MITSETQRMSGHHRLRIANDNATFFERHISNRFVHVKASTRPNTANTSLFITFRIIDLN